MAWRVARSLEVLRAEVDARWPGRDKTSDGSIGDAAHASRQSDHNPWVKDAKGVGVVRARDFDVDGIVAAVLFEHLRLLGKAGDPRLAGDGYLILNWRIASAKGGWVWRTYNGSNGHTGHGHISVTTNPAGYDSAAPWGVATTLEEGLDMDNATLKQLVRDVLGEPNGVLDRLGGLGYFFRGPNGDDRGEAIVLLRHLVSEASGRKVSEQELAEVLLPGLLAGLTEASVGQLSPATLGQVAKLVNDEADRRERERLGG